MISSCQELASQEYALERGKPAAPSLEPIEMRPTIALSLTLLQEQVKKRQVVSNELAHLSGMNRIHGFMSEPNGELLLLGDQDPTMPSIHLDDLVVALRNAYQVSPSYQGVLGCTIDPWAGAADPWRIQQVRVFGMPAAVAMAARHVAIDFELKKVSAGILSLGKAISNTYELTRSAAALCQGPLEQQMEATHRFWFYPLYPPAPRFLEGEGVVLISRPVEVQLMTEREFLDRTGQRNGSTRATPEAEGFAQLITQLLNATSPPRHYVQLRNDFRVIEVGQLLRFKQVPPETFRYLLQDYRLMEAAVPAFVGGIRREEHGELVCESEITERLVPEGKLVESRERVQRYQFSFRGGVEARVNIDPDHFVQEHSGILDPLRHRVRLSRPSAHALLWPISY